MIRVKGKSKVAGVKDLPTKLFADRQELAEFIERGDRVANEAVDAIAGPGEQYTARDTWDFIVEEV